MSDISKNHIAAGDALHQPPPNRAETNRANAQSSTGPRTEAGKKRSSLNALRHGLTGHTIVLPSDDLVAYERHCQEVHDQYRPKNKMEVLLAQMLADLAWRLNRITAIEANMLTMGINEHSDSVDTENHQAHSALAMAQAFRQQSRDLANLSMYEQRLATRFQKTLKQLQDLQAARVGQEKLDIYFAAKILRTHKNEKVPYSPVEDGFVFSNAEIETYVERPDRESQPLRAAS